MNIIVYFAHGNGFPSGCYQEIFRQLTPQYTIRHGDRIGHNEKFPVTDNWQYLVDELEENIINAADNIPVIGLGHSMGGVLHAMLAFRRPELYQGIIMLDSPLISRWKSTAIHLFKLAGMIDRITPAHHSRHRRAHWADYAEAIDYLKSRPLFARFTPRCLDDYINYGMQKNALGELVLRFDPDTEYRIYRTLPHNLYQYRGQLKVPAAVIRGTKSTVVTSYDLRYMRDKFNIKNYTIAGTHMFPFEDPVGTAKLIIKISKELFF